MSSVRSSNFHNWIIESSAIAKKKFLIIGGTGFIGGALVRALINMDETVHCLAFADRNQKSRLSSIRGNRVVVAAKNDSTEIQRALAGVRPDIIINLAGGGVRPDERTAANLSDGNSRLTLNLLHGCVNDPPELFIQAGSWSEYSISVDRRPIAEDHLLTTKHGYGAAKSAATGEGLTAAGQLGISFVALRLFNVYGPGEAPFRLIPFIIDHLYRHMEVPLTMGDQVRDFIFIDDVVSAFIEAARSDSLTPGGVYNICTGNPASVRHVAERVARALKRPTALLRFGDLSSRTDEPKWVVGDGRKFRLATHWLPKTVLDQGITKTVDHYFRLGHDQ